MARQQVPEGRRPELVSLLWAAKQHPDDDARRLVLADWLEENGDESDVSRAEFIRSQLEQARLPAQSPARRQAQEREGQMLKRYGPQWCGPVWDLGDNWRFERGLMYLDVPANAIVGRKGER